MAAEMHVVTSGDLLLGLCDSLGQSVEMIDIHRATCSSLGVDLILPFTATVPARGCAPSMTLVTDGMLRPIAAYGPGFEEEIARRAERLRLYEVGCRVFLDVPVNLYRSEGHPATRPPEAREDDAVESWREGVARAKADADEASHARVNRRRRC